MAGTSTQERPHLAFVYNVYNFPQGILPALYLTTLTSVLASWYGYTMSIYENPDAPTRGEADLDAFLDTFEAPHDCGTCEWCVATATRVRAMLPLDSNPPF